VGATAAGPIIRDIRITPGIMDITAAPITVDITAAIVPTLGAAVGDA